MPAGSRKLFYWITLYLYILFVWTYYHLVTHFPGWVDEIIFKPFVQLFPILYVVFLVEKEGWKSLGFSKEQLGKKIILGVWVALGLIAVRFVIKYIVAGGIVVNPQHLSVTDYAFFIITSCIVGFLEETIFRGYFFQRLWWACKNEFLANIVTSCMFALAHMSIVLFILHSPPLDFFFYFMQIVVMGIVFAYMSARRKSTVPSMAAHAVWKFSNALF